MSTNAGQPAGDGAQRPFAAFEALNAFDQAPAFLAPDYNPLFPMSDSAPLDALDSLDPEETFDALFGDASPAPAEDLPEEEEPDLATMKVARPPALIPPLPLPLIQVNSKE